MGEGAVEEDPYCLRFVSDQYKIQRMFERALEDKPRSSGFVPDRFVTFKMLEDLHNDEELDNHDLDEPNIWCNVYKQPKKLVKQIGDTNSLAPYLRLTLMCIRGQKERNRKIME